MDKCCVIGAVVQNTGAGDGDGRFAFLPYRRRLSHVQFRIAFSLSLRLLRIDGSPRVHDCRRGLGPGDEHCGDGLGSGVHLGGGGGPAARSRAVFLRPKTDKYWMGWPGASYDIRGRQADYTKTMADAAQKLGVDLQVDAEPVVDLAGVDALAAQCTQSPPDGVILIVGGLSPNYWPHAELFLAKRGEIPTIVFSPMGTSFTSHLQPSRKAAKCFVAATQDHGWLATGVRILWTIAQMDRTRLCIVNGEKTYDEKLAAIGTTLHHVPLKRWTDELAKIGETAEIKALVAELSGRPRRSSSPMPTTC